MKTESNIRKKQQKKRPVVRRVILILIGLILGVNVYLANAKGIVGNQLPMPFGHGFANVLSGSMEPTFSKGTLLFVKETDDVQVGDIVVYQSGNELIVHRIVALDGESVVTQGDANNVADPVFSKSKIKGVVTGWIPHLGMIVSLLKTPVGIVLILIIAFFLVEGSYRRQRETDDQELEAIKDEIRRLKAERETEEEEKEKQEKGGR